MVQTSKFIKIASEYYKYPHASTAHKLTKASPKKKKEKTTNKMEGPTSKKTNEPPKRAITRVTSSFQTPPLMRNI
jgi:hypothetical protein